MIRLAIETATAVGTVAVGRGGLLLAEVALGVQTRHAEAMLPALDAALDLAGVERSEIEEVVVGSGPGSFTGVRVAAATAKGVVAALDRPLLAYPSLLALAAGIPADRPVCALFDARRGEVYAGCWRIGKDRIETILAPMVGRVEEVRKATAAEAPLFAGDGALRYQDALFPGGPPVSSVPSFPRASVLLWLAEHHPAGGRVDDVGSWEPAYVRGSSAERGVAG
jgi:tRNA threonylcarbamoyladenosine biosynthesis protein TsaB